MTAREIISPMRSLVVTEVERHVDANLPVMEVLPRLLDSPGRVLGVVDEGNSLGVIDETSLLEGLGRLITPRDDTSVIVVECAPADYSASRIAHAVEDADAHLVDLLSAPAEEGRLRVTLRVRMSDPSAAVHSLERYGYEVVDAYGAANSDMTVSTERLLALRNYLNV